MVVLTLILYHSITSGTCLNTYPGAAAGGGALELVAKKGWITISNELALTVMVVVYTQKLIITSKRFWLSVDAAQQCTAH